MSSSIIDSPILKQRLHFSLEKIEHYLFLEVPFLPLSAITVGGVWRAGEKKCPKFVLSLTSNFFYLHQKARHLQFRIQI